MTELPLDGIARRPGDALLTAMAVVPDTLWSLQLRILHFRKIRNPDCAVHCGTVMLYVTFSVKPAPTPETKPPPNLIVCFPGESGLSISQ
jgi:hypothetical protein